MKTSSPYKVAFQPREKVKSIATRLSTTASPKWTRSILRHSLRLISFANPLRFAGADTALGIPGQSGQERKCETARRSAIISICWVFISLVAAVAPGQLQQPLTDVDREKMFIRSLRADAEDSRQLSEVAVKLSPSPQVVDFAKSDVQFQESLVNALFPLYKQFGIVAPKPLTEYSGIPATRLDGIQKSEFDRNYIRVTFAQIEKERIALLLSKRLSNKDIAKLCSLFTDLVAKESQALRTVGQEEGVTVRTQELRIIPALDR